MTPKPFDRRCATNAVISLAAPSTALGVPRRVAPLQSMSAAGPSASTSAYLANEELTRRGRMGARREHTTRNGQIAVHR